MSIMRRGLLALMGLTICGVALAYTEVGDLGPRLRDFDASKDCKCVQSSIARKQALLNNYLQLAESYKKLLTDLGDGRSTPTWVDPNVLSAQQINRLRAFNSNFDEEEAKLAEKAPEADCGFPPGKSIVLQTDSVTGEPPSKQEQQEAKPLFPSEQIYDAVMLHEYYHHTEWTAHNTGRNAPAGRYPRTRTPYGRALEEAKGYEIEINWLENLAKECRPRWKGKTHLEHRTCLDTSLVTIDAEVTFELSEEVWGPGIETYYAQGTAMMVVPPHIYGSSRDYRCPGGSVTFPLCANNPGLGNITMLQINTNTDPQTYKAMGACSKPSVDSACSNGRHTINRSKNPSMWFQTSKDFKFTLSVRDNNTLSGSYVDNPGGCNTYKSSWHFTREAAK